MNTNKRTLIEVIEEIKKLDLDPIKIKLMDESEGEGWTREQADRADLLYRRFLFLTVKYPEQTIVPSKVIDKIWHAHILDTQKYFDDCNRLFGKYLHHFPYLGMRGEDDAKNLAQSFDETSGIYSEEFGEDLSVNANMFNKELLRSSACNDSPANCWPASCNSKCNVKREDNSRPKFENPSKPVDIFAKELLPV